MIPPIGFKLDEATVEYLRDDLQMLMLHLNREGCIDDADTVEMCIERIDSAVRTFGVAS